MEESVKERLIREFTCAISACLGDNEDKLYKDGSIDIYELCQIANKVAFYLYLYERLQVKKEGK